MKVDRLEFTKILEAAKPGLSNKERIEQTTSFCFIDGYVVTFNDQLSVRCPAEEVGDLTGAVNAEELYNFISKVKSESVDIEINEKELLIKAGRSKVGLVLETDITLPIEEVGEIKKWKTLPTNFTRAMMFCAAACSSDMMKPALTCIHVVDDLVEGADPQRIANYFLDKKIGIPEFLIPANICNSIKNFEPVKISEGENWVHFKNELGAILSCRLPEEKYVNTAQHMEVEGTEIEFPKTLESTLDKARVFSKKEHAVDEEVEISIQNNSILVKSVSKTGWFKEKNKVKYEGDDPISFFITPYLLLDILKQVTSAQFYDKKLLFQTDNWKYLTLTRSSI